MASLISLTCRRTLLWPRSQHMPIPLMPDLKHKTTRAACDVAAEFGSDGPQGRSDTSAAILAAHAGTSNELHALLGHQIVSPP